VVNIWNSLPNVVVLALETDFIGSGIIKMLIIWLHCWIDRSRKQISEFYME